jgi:hypothetical protein
MAALVNACPCCSSNQNRGDWHVFGRFLSCFTRAIIGIYVLSSSAEDTGGRNICKYYYNCLKYMKQLVCANASSVWSVYYLNTGTQTWS